MSDQKLCAIELTHRRKNDRLDTHLDQSHDYFEIGDRTFCEFENFD